MEVTNKAFKAYDFGINNRIKCLVRIAINKA